jgi:hypothetical protein
VADGGASRREHGGPTPKTKTTGTQPWLTANGGFRQSKLVETNTPAPGQHGEQDLPAAGVEPTLADIRVTAGWPDRRGAGGGELILSVVAIASHAFVEP